MKFYYEAFQRDGTFVSGLIEAPSQRGAQRDLLKRGMQPTSISIATRTKRVAHFRRKINRRDHIVALKQLHALIAGGVPIAEAVTLLGEAAAHPLLAETYEELTASLRRGEPFPRAFARSFAGIPPHIHRIIEAGDLSGRFAAALADATADLEQGARVSTELRQTLIYPLFLLAFGCAAIVFIFLIVVPRFAVMFRGKFDQLPLLSYVVIRTGLAFRSHLLLALAMIAGTGVFTAWVFSHPTSRRSLFDAVARLPLLQGWWRDVETARWAAVLGRLLENRVPLIQSLELARGIVRRRDIQLQLSRVEHDVRAGAAVATALSDSAFLTPEALAMIRVGERSGSLPEMIRSLAALHQEVVRDRSRRVLAIIEPLAIVLIGAVIGLVAIAIFLAITSINNVPGL
jgi:general secretion pathway protein F